VKLLVIGGGIAGLAAAHRAVELAAERGQPLELMLLEASARLGGTIRSERFGEFLVEDGPDSFLTEKPWALDLCRRIGAADQLIRTDDRHRRTFVAWRGRLHPLPEGFQLLAPTRLGPLLASRLFSWPGKLRMGLDLVLPRGGDPDETLGAFVRRRLGREALERVAQPLVAGIYTADPDSLSLAATMPRFQELERRERSVVLAMWRAARRAGPRAADGASGARWSLFATLADGMADLVRRLAGRLPARAVRLGERVIEVARAEAGWRAITASGASVIADAVVIAVESHQAQRMLRAADPSLSHLLGDIAYASSAIVTLGYRRADVAHPLDGFGFVVPHAERRPLIACTFSSVKFPGRAPEGHVLLRVFMGGALQAEALEVDDDDLQATARAELAALLGARGEPAFIRVVRHPRAMPQYQVGHLARVEAIELGLRRHPGLALAGGGYRGVGIPDCIRSGEVAAERLLDGPVSPGTL